ncbi:MAG: hydroxyacid dehydrogenase [Acidiferrobacteraceae bacterium]|nr:hydroxyacid dehydrogenase [Acidiferrobacteraceae bacterium]
MFIESLKSIVGSKFVIEDQTQLSSFIEEARGDFKSETRALIFPKSTEETAAIVLECKKAGISIVPQGGNTGLCGGAVSKQDQIILNLSRMNQILAIDNINDTLTVEAGCILNTIQDFAKEHDRYFPLSLGAEGSCQIGGNLSTNAGGINVLRYGNVRDQVLGLEAVLANGEVWNGMTELRKNNTGYDLKNLLIGSEGTLGIITKIVLRLFPLPRQIETAFVALSNLESSLELLANARSNSGGALSSFELIPGLGIELAERYIAGINNPLESVPNWSVIMVYSSSSEEHNLQASLEATLSNAFESGILTDGVISQNQLQTKQIWAIREGLREAQTMEGVAFTHDVSVKVSQVPDLIKRAANDGERIVPGVRVYPFGHVGDGNIHLSFLQPNKMDKNVFQTKKMEFSKLIFDIINEFKGSFSAEHGIGLLRLNEMSLYKSPTEIGMMLRIKDALDPEGILNPGKVIPR